MDKTKIDMPLGNPTDKTQIFSGGTSGADLNKTQIFQGATDQEPVFNSASDRSGRKLVGWLVSFTIDANGADFRLFEGRNIVGSDPACDIVVGNDHTISTKHLTILYRMGVFKFKDEFSTNGTFINEEFKEEGNLVDGDTIKVGNTLFRFRTV
ncbi:MAG: FHA domain-containing protein [Bacteroidota bacterium]